MSQRSVAAEQERRRARREAVRRHHPDVGGDAEVLRLTLAELEADPPTADAATSGVVTGRRRRLGPRRAARRLRGRLRGRLPCGPRYGRL